ncbi:hypothetical protein C7999DRAFT_15823 [Corynascus novoguineensis]|uniref:ATP-grasp domain-containing protein n=1 Tax=Corynascus novoguineensis TaxID=1126955 RepID=A0AAN7CPQ6_9PEZI|nr:hypothetical protein C7999DRAFT_15823 [Corynascus novoguineensis]
MAPLVTAFIYDSYESYRAQGFDAEACEELEKRDTVEAIIRSLEACGHEVVPVAGIQQLVAILAEGGHKSWDLAFFTAEGMYGAGREAQVPGLLEAYQIPHVLSDAATLALTLDKGLTKIVLEHHGIPTAPFAIIPAILPSNADSENDNLESQFPLFIKPACEGSSKGIYGFSKVHSTTELVEGVRQLWARYPDQNVVVERFLAGAEYTVSVVGTGASARVVGTAHLNWQSARTREIREADYSLSYWAIDGDTDKDEYPVCPVNSQDNRPEVRQAEEVALRAWRALGCRDTGRIDTRCGLDGSPYVLEINAIPGLRPKWSALTVTAESNGIDHEQLIRAVVESALERYPHLRSKKESSVLRN